MGLALARPQWGETTEMSQALGEDMLFVLDCSKSMLATDVPPSRLDRARNMPSWISCKSTAAAASASSRFAGQAFLQCPLTFDYDAFREALLAVDEKTIPVPGTDIGRALDEGFAAMEKNDRRKIMVLVTDGEDLEKSGITTARKLAEKGIWSMLSAWARRRAVPIRIVNEQGAADYLARHQGQRRSSASWMNPP